MPAFYFLLFLKVCKSSEGSSLIEIENMLLFTSFHDINAGGDNLVVELVRI